MKQLLLHSLALLPVTLLFSGCASKPVSTEPLTPPTIEEKPIWFAPQASFTYMNDPAKSDVAQIWKNTQYGIGAPYPVTHIQVRISWIEKDPLRDEKTVHREILHFDFDSDTLTKSEKQRLDRALEQLQGKSYRIVVEGRTDDFGTKAYNDALSRRRALAVKRLISAAGLSDNRIIVRAYGETRPIESNATEEGRKTNRSVILRWLPPQEEENP